MFSSEKQRHALTSLPREAAQQASNPNDVTADHLNFANQLAARLNGLENRESSPEIDRRRRQTLSPEVGAEVVELFERDKKLAHHSYHELVKCGGRPLYRLDELDRIAASPSQYAHLLQPWAHSPDCISKDDWNVFHGQLRFWQSFKFWQHGVRGKPEESDDREFDDFFAWKKGEDDIKNMSFEEMDMDYYSKAVRNTWEDIQYSAHQLSKSARRKHAIDSLADYQRVLQKHFAQRGLNVAFSLKDNSNEQDYLSTWLEYIFYISFISNAERQVMHKQEDICTQSWQKLSELKFIDSTISRPETVKDMNSYVKKIAQVKLPPGVGHGDTSDRLSNCRETAMKLISAASVHSIYRRKYETFVLREKASLALIPAIKAEQETTEVAPRAANASEKAAEDDASQRARSTAKPPQLKRKRDAAVAADTKAPQAKVLKGVSGQSHSRHSPIIEGLSKKADKDNQPVTGSWQSRLRKRPQRQINPKDALKPPSSRNKSAPRSKNETTNKEQGKTKRKANKKL